MAPFTISVLDLGPLTGPYALSYLWGSCLYGILIVQMCVYSIKFAHERRALKTLVWLVFLTQTLFIICLTIGAWKIGGPGWGDVDTLLVLDWSFCALLPLVIVLSIMVRGFYAWRIRCLSGRFFIPLAICCVALVDSGFLLHVSVMFAKERSVFTFIEFAWEVSTGLAAAAACDITITVSVVILLSNRKTTGFKKTESVINQLVRFNIETGFLTSIAALVELVLFQVVPHSTWYIMVFQILGGLYSNTFMATLNYRAWISAEPGAPTIAITASTQHWQHSAFWSDYSPPRMGPACAQQPTLSNSRGDHELALVCESDSVKSEVDVMPKTDGDITLNVHLEHLTFHAL
ncbi:hypothetical protein BDZ89DRAFT_1078919 [Hymenopellis radicata]|nr:hypothetical protein BDZ89DRAFT_1078919 [Hymenopellis radicata]